MAEEANVPPLSEVVSTTVAKGMASRAVLGGTDNKNDGSEIAIIRGLGHEDFLREIWLMFNGYEFDFIKNAYEQKIRPIMNPEGIRNLHASLKIILRADFSKFNEKEIPRIVYEIWSTNFAQFLGYKDDYELDYKNVNMVHNAFFTAALIAFKNAEGAGHRNTVRGVLSENALNKLAEAGQQKKEGILARLNPLKMFGK